MVSTIADHGLDRLRAWGVDTVFGCASDGTNGPPGACAGAPTVREDAVEHDRIRTLEATRR